MTINTLQDPPAPAADRAAPSLWLPRSRPAVALFFASFVTAVGPAAWAALVGWAIWPACLFDGCGGRTSAVAGYTVAVLLAASPFVAVRFFQGGAPAGVRLRIATVAVAYAAVVTTTVLTYDEWL